MRGMIMIYSLSASNSSAKEALNDGMDRLEALVCRVHDITTWAILMKQGKHVYVEGPAEYDSWFNLKLQNSYR